MHYIKQQIGRLARRTGYEIRRLNRPSRLVFKSIPGWFSVDEAETLYALSLMARGRILEVGHFLGRSTSVICQAIRESGRSTEFRSYDLGFKNGDEFACFYKRLYGRGQFDVPPEYEQMVYSRGMTTTQVAHEHLARFGLDKDVELISGDATLLDQSRYDLIFCDAMHDPEEVEHNAPFLVRWSRRICTWAVHDTNSSTSARLQELTGAKEVFRSDTLGVFQFVQVGEGE